MTRQGAEMARRQAAGLCRICASEPEPGRVLCRVCLKSESARRQKARRLLKNVGLCVRECGRKRLDDSDKCRTCFNRERRYQRDYRKRKGCSQ